MYYIITLGLMLVLGNDFCLNFFKKFNSKEKDNEKPQIGKTKILLRIILKDVLHFEY